MGLHSGGLITGRILVSVIWWGGGGAYFQEGLFFRGPVTGILRYS